MRVLIAPDKYAGTLTAAQAAEAIATGWRRTAPRDVLDLAPLSDGGPGFVDALHAALGGELHAVTVSGPFGDPVPATVLLVERTAHLESAQACGLHLTGGRRGDEATTYGVGELLLAALDLGVDRIVVGLGGSGTNDGGAGLLAALGASADVPLDRGVAGLAGITQLQWDGVGVRDVELVAASDVDNPLTGLFGASKVFGAQKGLDEAAQQRADLALTRFAALAGRVPALEPGAGAAGGLGYALGLLGASRRSGLEILAAAARLDGRIVAADLVVTGEGAFDASSRGGKVPVALARLAAAHARPTLVLAGRVGLGTRETRALGIDATYSLVEATGEQRALGDPAGALSDLAERVARTWSPGPDRDRGE
jgi:glycerate kinase